MRRSIRILAVVVAVVSAAGLDSAGAAPTYNRRVTVSWSEGSYHSVVYNQVGNATCVGRAQALPNNGFRVTLPVAMCMGGAHVIRVASKFSDDHADAASDDISFDRAPTAAATARSSVCRTDPAAPWS